MSVVSCPACDSEYAPTALACPNCQRLVHSEALKQLGADAAAARRTGDLAAERRAWQGAIPLLPSASVQRQTIEKRLAELDAEPQATVVAKSPAWAKRAGALGVALLVLWKFKAVLLFALGKLKFLAVGLSKASTMFSFLLSFGVYWSLWGWRYALGFLVAMYIHEMGHVAALRRYGIPASAPMFVPGFGAFVRMNQHPSTIGEDARIGLAGPQWGLGAALAAYITYGLTGAPIWAAIGHSAAYLNLFNLLPVWQLDGGRGFEALSRVQRAGVALSLGAAWAITAEGLLGLICVVAAYRAIAGAQPEKGDTPVMAHFVGLIVAFSAMLLLGEPKR
jgi:Zn-dependent protease